MSLEVAVVSQSVRPPPEAPSFASEERVRWPLNVKAFILVVAAPPMFKVVAVVLNKAAVIWLVVKSPP